MNTITLTHRVPHYSLCVVNTHVIPPELTVIIICIGAGNCRPVVLSSLTPFSLAVLAVRGFTERSNH